MFIDFIASIVIDGEFLTAPPEEMLSTGNYKTDINLLASIVEDEYSFNMHSLGMAEFAPKTPAPFSYDQAKEFLAKLVTEYKPFHSLGFNYEEVSVELLQKNYLAGLNPAKVCDDDLFKIDLVRIIVKIVCL